LAAGVADAGQAVVFRAKGDVQRARAGARAKRGREVADASPHAETRVSQGLGNPGRRLLLLPSELGMGVNPMAQVDQALAVCLKPLAGSGFGVHQA
jgi:hypothetical protein